MRIIFEEYGYPAELIKKYLPETFLYNSAEEKLKTTFVGYFYSEEINDVVFCLPKVFVTYNKNNKCSYAFGKKAGSDVFLDLLENGILSKYLTNDERTIISSLSFWLYQAITRFANQFPETTIVHKSNVQEALSIGDYDCATLVDIILSLRKFNHDHQNLVTFILNINHNGTNKVDWNRTIRKVQPLIQNGYPIYLRFYNKKKVVNLDEEIIVLFYSTLAYLQEKYNFEEAINYNFNIIPAFRIEGMIDCRQGTIYLNKIRHKYFTDELVLLWNLLYLFYDKAEKMRNKSIHQEDLLASSFNTIFESMVDTLIGNEQLGNLKNQKDGKVIDHIYRNPSLVHGGDIYYIADSKYYKESTDLGENSVYKQFTYAKNVIQYNIDLFNKSQLPQGLRYRDALTEGYNITPNYFIRATAIDKERIYDYSDMELICEFDKDSKEKEINKLINNHFPNRLFDRDTQILMTYNINFLYVLAKYVEGGDEPTKNRIRLNFKKDLIKRFNGLYWFFRLTAKKSDIEFSVDKHFRLLLGKIYRPTESSDYVVLALEKDYNYMDENNKLLNIINNDFYIELMKL